MDRAVRIGCSGWQYKDWRGGFYPERCPQRRWLSVYARSFSTVEVNSTFYRLARPAAVARWVEETPSDFVLAVKASRYLTHVRRLRDIEEGIGRYYEAIGPLVSSQKLGPVLWQLPANFKRDEDRLAEACALLPPGRHCWEFRDPSWFTDDVYAILRACGTYAPRPRCSPTSTTTGRRSPRATPRGWRRCWPERRQGDRERATALKLVEPVLFFYVRRGVEQSGSSSGS